MRMKSLTTNVAHVRIVEIISDQWISQMLHMNADLVCASGLKLQCDQTVMSGRFYNMIMGDSGFAVIPVHHTLDDGAGFSAEWGRDGASFGRYVSRGNGKVFPVDFPASGHRRENSGTDQMFCHDSKSGGIPIQSVTASEDKWLVLLLVVPRQCIGHCIIVIIQGRMDWHAGRFVQDNDIFVFIDNI